jgi:hypothetical protein
VTDDHRSPDELPEHLSIDELAELDEGLLAPERTSAIRAHLHGCADCRAQAEAIGATRSMLADLPRPTMPADVQDRLSDALDTELGAADTPLGPADAGPPPDSAEPVVDDTVVDLPARSKEVMPAPGSVSRPRFGRPTLAAGAAAAAVVLAVGAIVIGAINHGDSESGSSASLSEAGAPNSNSVIATSQPAHFFQTSTGREYTLANLQPDVQGLIARSPADAAAAPPTAAHSAAGSAAGNAGGSAATQGGAGRTVGAPNNGSKHAGRAPATNGKTKPTGTPSPTPEYASHPLALDQQPVPKPLQQLANSRAMILNCAAVLTGSHNAVPLAVDFGRWTNPPLRRVPSAIFVFKNPDPAMVSVYVTSPACDDGTFYTFRVVPLPG